MTPRFFAGLIVAVLLMLGGAAAAQAALSITSEGNAFSKELFEQAAGETPDYANPSDGNGYHNVIAEDEGPDGEPLFASDLINIGETSPIEGVKYLGPGTYHFICSVHPGMEADLKITGGTPVARPKIKVSIPSQKLKKVRKSGALKVDVKGVNEANGVDLTVNKGKALIGTASDLSVPKGKTRTVPVTLTRSGKKAIKKGKKVTVSVAGSLPFGAPVSTKRTLR